MAETIPQIMIFSRLHVRPAARRQVCVCANTQVRTVDMQMTPICTNEIGEAKPAFYPLLMFDERIDVNNSGYSLKTPFGDGEVTDKPIGWNFTISVRVGQPTAGKRSTTTFNGRIGCHSSSRSHDPRIRLKHKSRILENCLRNCARLILRAIRHHDYIACYSSWQALASLLY